MNAPLPPETPAQRRRRLLLIGFAVYYVVVMLVLPELLRQHVSTETLLTLLAVFGLMPLLGLLAYALKSHTRT